MSDNMQAAINARVEAFAREISEIIQQSMTEALAQALQVTGGGSAAKAAPKKAKRKYTKRAQAAAPKKKAGGSRRKKGQKRTPEQLEAMTKALLKEIKRKGGRRIEEIGEALSIPTKELALPVKKLIADKQIKTVGQRRATRYTAK